MQVLLSYLTVTFAFLALLGGPLAAFVAVRVAIATVGTRLDESLKGITTQLQEVGKRLDKLDDTRNDHAVDLAALKVQVSNLEMRIVTLEHKP